jgi:hypothetical protein
VSSRLEEHKLNQVDDRGVSILYLAPEQNRPELLLFDEDFITEPAWKSEGTI